MSQPESALFLDLEASSLAPAGHPTEVGVALVAPGSALQVAAWTIRPDSTWVRPDGREWDPAAAAVTGLSPTLLWSQGLPAVTVVHALKGWLCRAGRVYSDAPEQDGVWLGRLYQAAGAGAPPALSDVMEIDRLQRKMSLSRARDTWERHLARVDARLGPVRHRAGPDAERLARGYLRLLGIDESRVPREECRVSRSR